MSPPLRAQVTDHTIAISPERLNSLLSACRRHDGTAAIEKICSWWQDYYEDDLTAWVRDECRLHIEGGRFQHALALLDRYSVAPQSFNRAEAKALIQRKERS